MCTLIQFWATLPTISRLKDKMSKKFLLWVIRCTVHKMSWSIEKCNPPRSLTLLQNMQFTSIARTKKCTHNELYYIKWHWRHTLFKCQGRFLCQNDLQSKELNFHNCRTTKNGLYNNFQISPKFDKRGRWAANGSLVIHIGLYMIVVMYFFRYLWVVLSTITPSYKK